MNITTFELILTVCVIPIWIWGLVVSSRTIRRQIIEKRKEAMYKRCRGCGSRLSEWFKTSSGYMRCFTCGTVSEYGFHYEKG
jgi:ribosomal protein S27E